jgi:hypothetical protein
MTQQPPPPISRDIGEAERTLRAVLQTQLDEAGLSFPEWTTFVTLDVAGPLTPAEVIERQVVGRVAGADEAEATIDSLVSAGLLGGGPRLAPTASGDALYRPIRQRVNGLSQSIYRDLPADDIEATRRTLEEVARRARAVLAEVDQVG